MHDIKTVKQHKIEITLNQAIALATRCEEPNFMQKCGGRSSCKIEAELDAEDILKKYCEDHQMDVPYHKSIDWSTSILKITWEEEINEKS